MKIFEKLLLFLLVCLVTCTFAACGGRSEDEDDTTENMPSSSGPDAAEEDTSAALVIIAGAHANANTFSDTMLQTAEELIEKSVRSWVDSDGKYCSEIDTTFIVSDGNPTSEKIVTDLGLEVETTIEANNDKTRDNEAREVREKVCSFLESRFLKATDEEVDLLAAINEAQVILDSKNADEKIILILDTGITTSGFFDMTTNQILDGTVDEVVGRIDDKGLPDLTGIKVQFLGLGNVASPQVDLRSDSEFRNRLVDVWNAILSKCNAELIEDIKFAEASGEARMWIEDDEESGYPYVTPVVFEYPVEEEPATPGEDREVLATPIPASALFEPNSDVLRDEAAAINYIKQNVLSDLKAFLDYDKTNVVYIVGSIAKVKIDVDCKTDALSESRAKRIAELLESLGIDPSQMITIDAGTTAFSWRNAVEFDDDGSPLKSNWQKNRLVAIIPSCNTSEVQELVDAGYLNA